jgi:hypothetical protein
MFVLMLLLKIILLICGSFGLIDLLSHCPQLLLFSHRLFCVFLSDVAPYHRAFLFWFKLYLTNSSGANSCRFCYQGSCTILNTSQLLSQVLRQYLAEHQKSVQDAVLETLAKVESQEWGENTFAWARFWPLLGPCWTFDLGLFLRPLRDGFLLGLVLVLFWTFDLGEVFRIFVFFRDAS